MIANTSCHTANTIQTYEETSVHTLSTVASIIHLSTSMQSTHMIHSAAGCFDSDPHVTSMHQWQLLLT